MKYYSGSGLTNSIINNLPFELHLPSYNYCGPGTKLKKRLAENSQPINELDRSCMRHDIFYSKSNDINDRHEADKILAENAMQRVRASDASTKEKLSALAVAGLMKAKVKLGMGYNNGDKYQKRSFNMLKHLKYILKMKTLLQAMEENVNSIKTNKTSGKKNVRIKKPKNTSKDISNAIINSVPTEAMLEIINKRTERPRAKKRKNDHNDEEAPLKKSYKTNDESISNENRDIIRAKKRLNDTNELGNDKDVEMYDVPVELTNNYKRKLIIENDDDNDTMPPRKRRLFKDLI